MNPVLLKALTLLRLLAFTVLLYLALGWLAERLGTRTGSKVRGFFRLLCRPVTRPVSRAMPPGTGERRVLAISLGVVACIWTLLILLTEALASRG